jgi:hypothetical protein
LPSLSLRKSALLIVRYELCLSRTLCQLDLPWPPAPIRRAVRTRRVRPRTWVVRQDENALERRRRCDLERLLLGGAT